MDINPPKPEANALFSTFIMGLASASMIELGLIEDPQAKAKRYQPQLAQQYIDILAMLQKKTAGNLEADEKQLLDRVITDLKMQYVRVTQTATPMPKKGESKK